MNWPAPSANLVVINAGTEKNIIRVLMPARDQLMSC
jgi:hypothetical protein